ncbi:MAG: flagellar filament capping protein FliD [Gammaproteobacteria bacterium]
MSDTSWIGSLNIDQFVQQQMMREKAIIDKNTQPVVTQLTKSQTDLKTQISLYGQIQQLVASYQTMLTQLQTSFNPSFQVGLSNTGIASAQTIGTVSPGTHALHVTALAQGSSVASAAYTSPTAVRNITETVGFSIGPIGSPTASFNVNIGATDTLQMIAENINNTANINHIGVAASVVSTTSGYKLIISSNQTGIENQVNITESGAGANSLSVSTGVGGTATVLTTAADAEFTLDTLAYKEPTNTNIIHGLSISLLAIGDTNISLTPNNQVSTVSTAVQNVVTAYNQLISLIGQAQAQLPTPDHNLQLIQSSLSKSMNSTVLQGIGVVPNTTTQTVPVTLANGGTTISYITGKLQVDSAVLSTALTNNFTTTQTQLFDSQAGVLSGVLNNALNTGTGSVWRALNDSKSGGLITANKELSKLTLRISDENDKIDKMKSDLTYKYAALSVMLQGMQFTSNYLYQQMQAMSGNH